MHLSNSVDRGFLRFNTKKSEQSRATLQNPSPRHISTTPCGPPSRPGARCQPAVPLGWEIENAFAALMTQRFVIDSIYRSIDHPHPYHWHTHSHITWCIGCTLHPAERERGREREREEEEWEGFPFRWTNAPTVNPAERWRDVLRGWEAFMFMYVCTSSKNKQTHTHTHTHSHTYTRSSAGEC